MSSPIDLMLLILFGCSINLLQMTVVEYFNEFSPKAVCLILLITKISDLLNVLSV